MDKKGLELLRGYHAVLRHKGIVPPMNPGRQEELEREVADYLAGALADDAACAARNATCPCSGFVSSGQPWDCCKVCGHHVSHHPTVPDRPPPLGPAPCVCGSPFNPDCERCVLVRDLAAARDLADEMEAALLAVKAWRAGPEGPEIMFSEGTQMLDKVDAALSRYRAAGRGTEGGGKR